MARVNLKLPLNDLVAIGMLITLNSLRSLADIRSRPEEHIDNPKDYADNVDARQFDSRLRGPVDENKELAIDQRTGLKTYIASEDKGITTSAGLVRDLFGRCIYLGRKYGQTKDKADLYEALRLLGTGCHCLEDFSAHTNYVELALRNCGAEDVCPLVGLSLIHI